VDAMDEVVKFLTLNLGDRYHSDDSSCICMDYKDFAELLVTHYNELRGICDSFELFSS
jgi:hypothetical protein